VGREPNLYTPSYPLLEYMEFYFNLLSSMFPRLMSKEDAVNRHIEGDKSNRLPNLIIRKFSFRPASKLLEYMGFYYSLLSIMLHRITSKENAADCCVDRGNPHRLRTYITRKFSSALVCR
jgi:hypothetical protein